MSQNQDYFQPSSQDNINTEDTNFALALRKIIQAIPEETPPQWVLNKIVAHSRERHESAFAKVWQFFSRPAYGAFALFFVCVLSLSVFFPQLSSKQTADIASNQDMGLGQFLPHYSRSTSFTKHLVHPSISLVGLNQNDETSLGSIQFDFDDAIDQKIASKNFLTSSEVDGLFFRARKMEKLGYYQDALHDYEIIISFYPKFQHSRLVYLSMARSLKALGETEKALQILDLMEKRYAKDAEIPLVRDEIKSETL